VENASGGGQSCGIDPETGRVLGPARNLEGESFEAHPASGVRFAGAEAPDIQAVCETARPAHRVLDTSMSIGWDVAMTPKGPSIIEGNGHWMPELHRMADGGFEHRLWQAFMADRKVAGAGFHRKGRRIRRGDMIRAALSIRGKVQGVG